MKLLLIAALICCLGHSTGFSFEARQDNLGSITSSSTDVGSQPRPTILQQLGKMRFGRWIPYADRFLRFLDDQEVSNKINYLIADRRQILQQGLGCIEKNIVTFLNDASNTFGRLVGMLRMGQAPLTSLRELRQINPYTILPMLWIALQNLNFNQAVKEVEDGIRSLSDTCLNGDLKKYKDEVEYVISEFDTKVLKKMSRK